MKVSLDAGAKANHTETPRAVVLICLVLALVTFGLYQKVVHYDFVNYDDFTYVTENPHVQNGLTPAEIVWAFTTGHASNWHPLTWISHMVDCRIYGIENPGGHHLTNVLFHLANTVLLFLLLRRMTGAMWRSGVVAALFAWHPLHVESVAWVAERKDVLSTFFWLLTMFAYLRYVKEFNAESAQIKKWYRWTLVLFTLGLMSKPMLVTLPFVLLLVDCWPLGRSQQFGIRSVDLNDAEPPRKLSWKTLVREKAPMFVLVALSCIVTYLAQKSGGAVMATELISFKVRLGNAFLSYFAYLQKTVWPAGLAIFYPLPQYRTVSQVVAAALVLIAISVWLVRLARSRPYLLFGWLWFLGVLVPVIGLVQVGGQSMADRYSYMSSVGLFIMFAWGLADLIGRGRRGMPPLAWLIIAPVLIVYFAVAWQQVPYWKNSETLFRRDLAVTTNNILAHINLGRALDDAGRPMEAKAEFTAALKLEPESPSTLNGVGVHYAKQGDLAHAADYYVSALRTQPFYSDAHYNLGNVLAHEGKFAEAADQYSQAVRLKPDAPDAHNNLGAVLLRLDRPQEALDQFQEALRLKPNFPEAQDQLGSIYFKLGHPDVAQIHFAEAVRLKPDFAHAQLKLGVVLASQGYLAEALPHFEAAIKLQPQNPESYFDLAAAYVALNRMDDAIKMFNEVIRLNPNDVQSRTRLAAILTTQGKTETAIQTYRDALKIKSDAPEPLRGLAWILATTPKAELRNGAEAVRLAEQANELTGKTQPLFLSTLDVAYAEAGRFEDAIKTAQHVQEIATANKLTTFADQAAKRLELYRAGKPFHE